MNMNELELAIMKIDNIEMLRYIGRFIQNRRKTISSKLKYELRIGQEVIVDDGKNRKEEGVVKKVNRTRAVVDLNGMQYNVPFSMIAILEKP